MSRRYADRIEVAVRSAVHPGPGGSDGTVPPDRFVWRRRRYRVRAVLQCWIETGSWWSTAGDAEEEYQMWRVEAAAERSAARAVGQFDLCRHPGSGHWFLVRAFD